MRKGDYGADVNSKDPDQLAQPHILMSILLYNDIYSTLIISKSKELSEIIRDIRTSSYQICRIEEKKSNNHISQMNM